MDNDTKLNHKLTQITGMFLSMITEGNKKSVEWVTEVFAKDAVEVRIVLDGIEKTFTYDEFVGKLGF